MNDNDKWIFLAVFVAFLLGIIFMEMVVDRYKQGQIDAINGNVKYELREIDNGEMKWEALKERE